MPDPHYDATPADAPEETGGLGPMEIALVLETHYPRLKGLVRSQMARLTGQRLEQLTESPTVHTNNLCMELLNQRHRFRDAEHMMAVASIRCTQLVVDYLRQRGRKKRGGGSRGVALPDELVERRSAPAAWLLRDGIAEALTRYAEEFPRQSQTLMLRIFFGRTTPEVAEMLDVSTATAERDLRAARAYFRAVMGDGDASSDVGMPHAK